jgi:hypothetical protein
VKRLIPSMSTVPASDKRAPTGLCGLQLATRSVQGASDTHVSSVAMVSDGVVVVVRRVRFAVQIVDESLSEVWAGPRAETLFSAPTTQPMMRVESDARLASTSSCR